MSDSQVEEPGEPEANEDEEEFAPTPFDSPYLMPLLLFGFAAWFGYDGWLNEDPSMRRWWWFNQGGAVLFLVWGLFLLLRMRRSADGKPDA